MHASKLGPCYTKVESVSVLLEQGGAFSDAEYEPRPAVRYAADICPFSDSSTRAGERYRGRVREDFGKSGVPFGGQPTSVEQHNVVSEERFILESSHPHKSAEAEARMLLEWERCRVECASVCYLGRVVGSTCHALDPEKLTVVRGLSSPTTETELRDFHGSCGHYLSYGPNYANVTRLPSKLTGGRVPNRIPWCAWADGASQRHGATLSEAAPVIRTAPEMPYWLFVDLSVATSEVCPSQRAESDAEASIAFARHGFSPTQTREPLSVSRNPRVFNHWLFDAQVPVVSDHHPLPFPTHARCRGHLIVARIMAAVLRGLMRH
uniref:Retrovirus-related Pol polyprotein from transposon opus n=1 Tax=Rhipicephalus appendiculatus TaxID=34631 RepID=A0A131YVI2_RHIAP